MTGEKEEEDSEEEKALQRYKQERDFSFFRARLGMSFKEYRNSTRAELALIAHDWEAQFVMETTTQRNAILNALANAYKKRSARFIELWKKDTKATSAEVEEGRALVAEMIEYFSGRGGDE